MPVAALPRLIYALDYPDVTLARAGAARVADHVGMLKVGLELFVGAGPEAVRIGDEHNVPVFLDLKLHDIPETVRRATEAAMRLGAALITVHAAGGPAMLKAAVEAAGENGSMSVAAVTVLTSFDDSDLSAAGVERSVKNQVRSLAQMAWDQGVTTFVCSAHEAALLRKELGDAARLITPGVRPTSANPRPTKDDQKRVMTPADAIAAGADAVVVGRPIRDALDPAQTARDIHQSIEQAWRQRSSA